MSRLQTKRNVAKRWDLEIRNDADKLNAYHEAGRNAILDIRLEPWYKYMIELIEQVTETAMSKTWALDTPSIEEIRYRQGVQFMWETLLSRLTDVNTPSE